MDFLKVFIKKYIEEFKGGTPASKAGMVADGVQIIGGISSIPVILHIFNIELTAVAEVLFHLFFVCVMTLLWLLIVIGYAKIINFVSASKFGRRLLWIGWMGVFSLATAMYLMFFDVVLKSLQRGDLI